MNELINLIKENFSTFVEVMVFIPSRFQIWYWEEAAVLVFILAFALGVVFLCDRLIKKYDLGFTTSILFTFLVLSLTLGLTGFFLSIPRLNLNPSAPFLIVGIGSPVFNLILGVVATLGNRLRNHHPIAGTLILYGVGFPFAYLLFTTFAVFFLSLYNY